MKIDFLKYGKLLKEGKYDKAREYRYSNVPSYVYKFIVLSDDDNENDKRLKTLQENKVWFAPPNRQNDPFEYLGWYIDDSKLHNKGYKLEDIKKAEEEFQRVLMTMKLCAFSTNDENNFGMWSHYANGHRGLCLRYRVKSNKIKSIIYTPKKIDMTNIFSDFIHKLSLIEKHELDPNMLEPCRAILYECFQIKYDYWEYENEYRYIYDDDNYSTGFNLDLSEVGLELDTIFSGYKCDDKILNQLEKIALELGVNHHKMKNKSISSFELTY